MEVIVTAVGEFIWISSCGIIDFCLSSGLSALVVFVSFLCGILASAFYKYTIHRERMLLDHDCNHPVASIISTRSSYREAVRVNVINNDDLVPEEEISHDQNTSTNIDDLTIHTTEDSEEEIQAEQIKRIYDLLNDDDLSTKDFLEQLNMYGVELTDDGELQFF